MISTITLAELSIGPLLAASSTERAARQEHLQQAEASFEALAFDRAAARAFGAVAADLRSHRRKPTARSFDALIAAVAIANGLALWTVNARDFAGIGRLDLVAVDHPDR